MFEPKNTALILHLRVHWDTGNAEMEGLPWRVSVLPDADGDFSLSIPVANRASIAGVLRHVMQMKLDLVTMHVHPACDAGGGAMMQR